MIAYPSNLTTLILRLCATIRAKADRFVFYWAILNQPISIWREKRAGGKFFEDVGSRDAVAKPHGRIYGVPQKTFPSPKWGRKDQTENYWPSIQLIFNKWSFVILLLKNLSLHSELWSLYSRIYRMNQELRRMILDHEDRSIGILTLHAAHPSSP